MDAQDCNSCVTMFPQIIPYELRGLQLQLHLHFPRSFCCKTAASAANLQQNLAAFDTANQLLLQDFATNLQYDE